jgi:hypothetical protein
LGHGRELVPRAHQAGRITPARQRTILDSIVACLGSEVLNGEAERRVARQTSLIEESEDGAAGQVARRSCEGVRVSRNPQNGRDRVEGSRNSKPSTASGLA